MSCLSQPHIHTPRVPPKFPMTFHHSPNSVFAQPFNTPDASKPPREPPRKPARKPRKARKPRRKPRNPVPPVDNFPVDNSTAADNCPADNSPQLIIEEIKKSMMTMSSQIDALVHSLKRKREDSQAPPAKRSLVSQLGGLDIRSPIPLDHITDEITDDTFFDLDFHLDADLDAADLDAADLEADLNEPGDPADLAAFLFKPVDHP